jgi:hypothetical protein
LCEGKQCNTVLAVVPVCEECGLCGQVCCTSGNIVLLQFLKKVLEMFAFGLRVPLIEGHILYCMLKFCELDESVGSD